MLCTKLGPRESLTIPRIREMSCFEPVAFGDSFHFQQQSWSILGFFVFFCFLLFFFKSGALTPAITLSTHTAVVT